MIEEIKRKITAVKSRREILQSIVSQVEDENNPALKSNIEKMKALIKQQSAIVSKFESLLNDIVYFEV